MIKKYFYALLICLFAIGVIVPTSVNSSPDTCEYHPKAYRGLEISRLSQELNSTGLIGRIHGAAEKSHAYVMSVREPDNFFSHQEFSLLSKNTAISNALGKLNRHDLVCVRGEIIANPSPQKHITLNSIEIIELWQQPEGFEAYERQVDLPEELAAQNSFVGKVHAIGEDGKVLVVEYKDGVMPIFVTETQYTQGLYRGDIVKLTYQIQDQPPRPVHLQLDTTVAKPLEVLDAIASWNGQPKTITGNLVKFPQSPQLKFDVYAVEVTTQGIKRYFTLINFEDTNEFEKIRQKLANIWNENLETARSGRNMLVNPAVTIEAKGIANIISTEQANPQILLDSEERVRQIAS